MLRESTTAVVARNDRWSGSSATEPYEAGWAREAVFFLRAMDTPLGEPNYARIQISPDGMRWIDEGTRIELPRTKDAVTFGRIAHFGNWLRLAADLSEDAHIVIHVTIHLK